MDDNMMYEYLLAMGAMRPEQDELKRKQAMVDALRQSAMEPQKGQMVSGHYVAPGLGGLMSQMGNAYMAKKGQGQVDTGMRGMNDKQRELLELLRKKKYGGFDMPSMNADPYDQFRYGSGA